LLDKTKLRIRREDIVKKLGGKCIDCGYDKDIRALQIDHVHGNGNKERKEHGSSYKNLKHIAENISSGDYQVLCANCNCIKKHTHNEWSSVADPMPEPITGELKDSVVANKTDGRFQKHEYRGWSKDQWREWREENPEAWAERNRKVAQAKIGKRQAWRDDPVKVAAWRQKISDTKRSKNI
jgi:hypothetical protein